MFFYEKLRVIIMIVVLFEIKNEYSIILAQLSVVMILMICIFFECIFHVLGGFL